MVVTFGLERLLEDEIAMWKAIMTYWFPERALIGKWLMSSLYNLLRGYTLMKTRLDSIPTGLGAEMGSAVGDKGVGHLGWLI
jgi:hypothetical protein